MNKKNNKIKCSYYHSEDKDRIGLWITIKTPEGKETGYLGIFEKKNDVTDSIKSR